MSAKACLRLLPMSWLLNAYGYRYHVQLGTRMNQTLATFNKSRPAESSKTSPSARLSQQERHQKDDTIQAPISASLSHPIRKKKPHVFIGIAAGLIDTFWSFCFYWLDTLWRRKCSQAPKQGDASSLVGVGSIVYLYQGIIPAMIYVFVCRSTEAYAFSFRRTSSLPFMIWAWLLCFIVRYTSYPLSTWATNFQVHGDDTLMWERVHKNGRLELFAGIWKGVLHVSLVSLLWWMVFDVLKSMVPDICRDWGIAFAGCVATLFATVVPNQLAAMQVLQQSAGFGTSATENGLAPCRKYIYLRISSILIRTALFAACWGHWLEPLLQEATLQTATDYRVVPEYKEEDLMRISTVNVLGIKPRNQVDIRLVNGTAVNLNGNDELVLESFKKPWDLQGYATPRVPIPIKQLDPSKFGGAPPGASTVDNINFLVVKIPGDKEMWGPKHMGDDTVTVHEILSRAHSLMPRLVGAQNYTDRYFAYLTIRQHTVTPGSEFRRHGPHYDGWNFGDRDYNNPEVNFHVSNGGGTVFFPTAHFEYLEQSTRESRANPMENEWKKLFAFREQAIEQGEYSIEGPGMLALMDAYSAHEEPLNFSKTVLRTFLRLQFSPACYGSYEVNDLMGNTVSHKFKHFVKNDKLCNNEEQLKFSISMSKEMKQFDPKLVSKLAKYLSLDEYTRFLKAARRGDAKQMNTLVQRANLVGDVEDTEPAQEDMASVQSQDADVASINTKSTSSAMHDEIKETFTYKDEDMLLISQIDTPSVEPRRHVKVKLVNGTEVSMDGNDERVLESFKHPWDLKGYQTPRVPIPLERLPGHFGEGPPGSKTLDSIRQLAVKIPGDEKMWAPKNMGKDTATVHHILTKAHSLMPSLVGAENYTKYYFAFLTIRQKTITPGQNFSFPGPHYDGWNFGDRVNNNPEVGFHASRGRGTVIFPTASFHYNENLSEEARADPHKNEWKKLSRFCNEAIAEGSQSAEGAAELALMDPYTAHQEPTDFKEPVLRTFLRLQYTTACYGPYMIGDADNPKFSEFFKTDKDCKNEKFAKIGLQKSVEMDRFDAQVRSRLIRQLSLAELRQLIADVRAGNDKAVEAAIKRVSRA